MQDKYALEVVAATGVYDSPRATTMVLKTDVVVTSSAGYTVRMNEAQIDIKTKPHGVGQIGRCDAVEQGRSNRSGWTSAKVATGCVFTGDVDVYLRPQSASTAPTRSRAAASRLPRAGTNRQTMTMLPRNQPTAALRRRAGNAGGRRRAGTTVEHAAQCAGRAFRNRDQPVSIKDGRARGRKSCDHRDLHGKRSSGQGDAPRCAANSNT